MEGLSPIVSGRLRSSRAGAQEAEANQPEEDKAFPGHLIPCTANFEALSSAP